MSEQKVYIVSQNTAGKWQVKKAGSQRALRLFDNKLAAIAYAKEVATNKGGRIKIDDEITTVISKIAPKKDSHSNGSSRRKIKAGKALITMIVGILVGIIVGGCSFQLFSGLDFRLLGDSTEEIHLNEDFVDSGYIATLNKVDISEYVKTSYKKMTGEEVSQIDTTIVCDYLVIYHLYYSEQNINITLIRKVNVEIADIIETDNLSIHFLEVGNKYTGDAIYIKAGTTDILIDAGSRTNSASAISNYINKYCTDGILEYVIATHAHQDHIAGFVGTTANPGIFALYTCETIIDYALSNSTSAVRRNYESLVQNEVTTEEAKHYTALECWNEENGAKRSYELADGITLNILYNYYYEHATSDENDYSVCILLTEGDNNYLFTGDLEKEGEKKLIEYNDLPEVELYKAGHHGSKTSSTMELLNVIKPKIVCVCCCAGSTEYTSNNDNTFPTQDFINRIKLFTDQIYVTTLVSSNEFGYESFNGTIIVTSESGKISVNCTNNNIILKDTDWFKKYRTW